MSLPLCPGFFYTGPSLLRTPGPGCCLNGADGQAWVRREGRRVPIARRRGSGEDVVIVFVCSLCVGVTHAQSTDAGSRVVSSVCRHLRHLLLLVHDQVACPHQFPAHADLRTRELIVACSGRGEGRKERKGWFLVCQCRVQPHSGLLKRAEEEEGKEVVAKGIDGRFRGQVERQ